MDEQTTRSTEFLGTHLAPTSNKRGVARGPSLGGNHSKDDETDAGEGARSHGKQSVQERSRVVSRRPKHPLHLQGEAEAGKRDSGVRPTHFWFLKKPMTCMEAAHCAPLLILAKASFAFVSLSKSRSKGVKSSMTNPVFRDAAFHRFASRY